MANEKTGIMKQAKLIGAIVIAVLALIVILQNTQWVETHILFISIGMPRAVLLIVTLLIGFAVGYLASRFGGRRRE